MYIKDFRLLIYLHRFGYDVISLRFTAEIVEAGIGAEETEGNGGPGGQREDTVEAGSDRSERIYSTEYSCQGNIVGFSDRVDFAVRVRLYLFHSSN